MKTAKISIFELKCTWQISISPIWWTPKKNNPGGPKSRKLLRRRWYANENNPSRCLCGHFKLYNQLCLPKHNPSAFHLQPLQKTTSDCRFSSWTIWFKNVLRGWNTWSQNQPLTKSYYSHVPSLPHKINFNRSFSSCELLFKRTWWSFFSDVCLHWLLSFYWIC